MATKSAPRPHPSGFSVGDVVEFGRRHGEKTRGKVVKTHGGSAGTGAPLKNLKVEQLEERGTHRVRSAGTVWTVPPSLMVKVGGSAPTPTASSATHRVGTAVRFKGQAIVDRKLVDAEVVGVVTRATGDEYEVYGGAIFGLGVSNVRASDILGTTKRSDEEILKSARGVYSSLSPENLTCDGELSRSAVASRRAMLNRALRALEAERGRKISEREAYGNLW